MRSSKAAVVILALAQSPTAALAQHRHRFSEPRLALTLPAGFAPFRPDARHPAVIDTLRRAPVGSSGPIVVQLLRLGGELPQRSLSPEERGAFTLGAPFSFDDRPASFQALGHALPGSVGFSRTPSGASVFRVAVLLPTRGNAVQLSVLARASEEAEARGILLGALRDLEAEVTWLTVRQRVLFAAATTSLGLAVLGTLVIVVRVLMQNHVTHLGPTAQRRISLVTGASWLFFALWLLLPLHSAEWAAAVPAMALAITFLSRAATLRP